MIPAVTHQPLNDKAPTLFVPKASETQDTQTELGDEDNGNCHGCNNSLLSEWIANQAGEVPNLCSRLAVHAAPEVLVDFYR